MANILVVDDDALIRSLIASLLDSVGYETVVAGSGREMFECLKDHSFNLVILDLGLPDEDGLALARKLRTTSSVPLMILTGRSDMSNRLAGLDVGADDYLTKGVNPEEFLLRVRNLVARGGDVRDATIKPGGPILSFSGWKLDSEAYSLISDDQHVATLTPMELNILAVLARNAGRVMSRDQLLDAISGIDDAPSDRMIDSFISRIRKQIEINPRKPKIIVTVTGVGYKLVPDRNISA